MQEIENKLNKIDNEYQKSIQAVKRFLKRKKMEKQFKNNKWRKK